jgi:transcriptional regulator with XRE-family HTH domain
MRHERSTTAPDAHPAIQKLRQIRMAYGLSVDEVAASIGCTRTTLNHMEAGQHVPSFKRLFRWADVLGYELNFLPKK